MERIVAWNRESSNFWIIFHKIYGMDFGGTVFLLNDLNDEAAISYFKITKSRFIWSSTCPPLLS